MSALTKNLACIRITELKDGFRIVAAIFVRFPEKERI